MLSSEFQYGFLRNIIPEQKFEGCCQQRIRPLLVEIEGRGYFRGFGWFLTRH
jgi:hypothetical protein